MSDELKRKFWATKYTKSKRKWTEWTKKWWTEVDAGGQEGKRREEEKIVR